MIFTEENLWLNSLDDEGPFLGMEWAVPEYSKGRVDEAARIVIDPAADIFNIFDSLEVVNNWRSSHNFPLNTFQNGLRRKGRKIDKSCIVAQRIKRFSSIEDKLQRFPTMNLSQMQDIGGCRAVLSKVDNVRALLNSYIHSDIKHKLHHIDDYIEIPRSSGYRGVHLIYRYYSDRMETYNSLLIELQLRSQHQHAWATAVETVGAFVGQALKASRGEGEWLRFFALMGTAIATTEGMPPVPDTPDNIGELRMELRDYAKRLDVVNRLVGYNTALRVSEDEARKADHYFLILLDPGASTVSVRTYRAHQSEKATRDYLSIEKGLRDRPGADAVLVSVESLATLRRAYPNYFADTAIFLDLLRQAIALTRRPKRRIGIG